MCVGERWSGAQAGRAEAVAAAPGRAKTRTRKNADTRERGAWHPRTSGHRAALAPPDPAHPRAIGQAKGASREGLRRSRKPRAQGAETGRSRDSRREGVGAKVRARQALRPARSVAGERGCAQARTATAGRAPTQSGHPARRGGGLQHRQARAAARGAGGGAEGCEGASCRSGVRGASRCARRGGGSVGDRPGAERRAADRKPFRRATPGPTPSHEAADTRATGHAYHGIR